MIQSFEDTIAASYTPAERRESYVNRIVAASVQLQAGVERLQSENDRLHGENTRLRAMLAAVGL